MICEVWKVCKVREIAKVIRGASPRPKGDPQYYGGTVPRLMVADVTRDGKYVTPQIDFLTKEGAKLSRPMPTGTLTIVCSGTVGIPAILAVDACIHDGFLAVDEVSEDCDIEFLYYLFSSLRQQFESSATHGGVFTNLTTEILREFQFKLPPIKQQREIAKILAIWDNAIAITEKLITAKIHLKQRLTKNLLTGKIKFLEIERSVIRSPNWQTTNLEDVAIFQNGKAHENDVVENGKFVIVNSKFISTEGKIRKYSNEQLFPLQQDDIAMVMSDIPNGRALAKCFYVEENKKFTLNQRICSIRAKNIDSRYLFYFLNRNKYFLSFDSGVGQTNLRKDDILKCPVLVPSILEQQKIAKTLNLMDQEISLLEKQLHSLKTQKQGLMQQLLTGKIRIQTP